jgi:hypothetical protein
LTINAFRQHEQAKQTPMRFCDHDGNAAKAPVRKSCTAASIEAVVSMRAFKDLCAPGEVPA